MKMQHFLGLSSLALLLLLPPLGWAQRTFHTPGGNITPGTEGTGQKPRGQDISPAGEKKGSASVGSKTEGTSKGPSTFVTPAGSITPGSEGKGEKPRGQDIRPAAEKRSTGRVEAVTKGTPSRGILIGTPPTAIQKGEPGAARVTPGLTPRTISVPTTGVPTGISAPTGPTGTSAPSTQTPVIEVPKVPSINVQ